MENEKTFDEIIMEELNELSSESSNSSNEETSNVENQDDTTSTENEEDESDESEETEDESLEDTDEDNEHEEDDENDNEESDNNDEINIGGNEKDKNAFIKLRQENAGYKKIVNYFDEKAKKMGFSGIDELMKKTDEAEMARDAKSKGIPLEIAKQIKSLEDKINEVEAREKQTLLRERETRLNNTVSGFIEKNKVSKDQFKEIANSLVQDGISVDMLMNLPQSTVSRILQSYVPNKAIIQKQIEKTEKAKKELPIDTKNSSNPSSVDDDIDKIAKYFAGKTD